MQYRPDSLNVTRKGLADPWHDHDACGVGAVINIKGKKSNELVAQGRQVLLNLAHRGACGCEENTGDGAGMLIQLPHAFLSAEADKLKFKLPAEGSYAVGKLFMPKDKAESETCRGIVDRIVKEEGQTLLGWRDVPTVNGSLGNTALGAEPVSRMVFIGKSASVPDQDAFERLLYTIRRRAENAVIAAGLAHGKDFYVVSMSSRTIVYKGMLTSPQLFEYFPDLMHPKVESAIAMVHSRFSTNTNPTWALAHPFRYLCHNGEINTLRGNINWMKAREALFQTPLYPGDKIKQLLPILQEGGSDSAIFDNALELLLMGGRTLPHAAMMMIPEAWEKHDSMSQAKKDFYKYHACMMEPWDGPAHIAFTDGRVFGAVLDRNGLRPSRYTQTKDGLVVLSSEAGVLPIAPEAAEKKDRLRPGAMFLIDTVEGRIVDDVELKEKIVKAQPYGEWLKKGIVVVKDLPDAPAVPHAEELSLIVRQKLFGYTHEDTRIIMSPMATNSEEPVGSMGTDTPLAVLSRKPQLLFNYFKQLFAQVTNPPLDAIREELVTSLRSTLGAEGDLLSPSAENCHQVEIDSPILNNEETAKLKGQHSGRFKSVVLSILYPVQDGPAGLERTLDQVCAAASKAVAEGKTLIVLSDRGAKPSQAPIPALLATAAVHHHLIRNKERTRASLIIESGEPREVHHFCLLVGYGANAVNPWLALETVSELVKRGVVSTTNGDSKALYAYVKAANKGVLKTMSKMGISTVQSYRGAQIFEAIGLGQELVDRYFTWTTTRLSGIGLAEIAAEARARHDEAFPDRPARDLDLEWGGQYQWRRDGEYHMWNPQTIHALQDAVRTGNWETWKKYAKLVNEEASRAATLRGMFEFKKGTPIPLDQVEPVTEIVKRFATGAMSYGSISKEAHQTMAIAMNRIGGRSNTGEGGEDVDRYTIDANGDNRNSAIKQVASARFGVTSEYLAQAKDLQIKMAQGAKPGEGGQLPGHKVYPWIAKTRHSTPFVGLISPPPHHDIYSIEDLAQLIFDLKNSNPKARIHVKLVAEVGVGTIAAGVAKGRADVVLISGYEGGTGASPLSSLKHAGVPWEIGLAETQQVLVREKLRDRIVVQTDGHLKTGRDVAIAALLGAEEFGFGTSALVSVGCILMRVCHLDTCPVGVATQNPKLREKFMGKPEDVINMMMFIARELREIMAELGFKTVADMVGRVDMLDASQAVDHWKAGGMNLEPLFHKPQNWGEVPMHKVRDQDHGIEKVLDNKLIEKSKAAIEKKEKVAFEMPITNQDRTTGALLGYTISTKHGGAGLPADTISVSFKGSAGQSFGAFIPNGVTFALEGEANDYLGKGLSGGKIVVFPAAKATFKAEENIIIGNVALYGATSGEAYFRGFAGERFCVRNSGATAVIEGVGDHGCEYMTAGRVAIIGKTGRNFAAGMSGGFAYVLDEAGDFKTRCNPDMVDLEPLALPEDQAELKRMLEAHGKHTGSAVAQRLLANWSESLKKFVKVYPKDLKKALAAAKTAETSGARH